MKTKNTFFIIVIFLLAIFSYLNSLHNEFLWDDEDWIQKNATIKDWKAWPNLFIQNTIQGARKGSNFYRPIQSITHGIDYFFWKDNVTGHHLASIFIHSLAAVLLFLLLTRLFPGRVSFLAAIFFAIHPVQTEAVAYISGRADPLSGLFIILSIILFEKNIILSCLAFASGVLSKESALMTPFLIWLFILFRKTDIKRSIIRLLPFVIIVVVYGLLRFTVLDFSSTIPDNVPKPFFYVPLYIRFFTFIKTIPIYLGLLLWPFGLHMERDVSLSYSIFEPLTLAGFCVVSILFIAAISLRKKHNIFLFAIIWFFITIFPNSNIIPINALIYEHWLYLPSVGFFIYIAWILNALFEKRSFFKPLSIILIIVIACFYIWRTIERNKEWRSPVVFYENILKYKKDSARVHNNLAMAYIDAGREEDAIREYKECIALGDYYPQPHYNLSNIYINREDYASAVKELKRSIEIDNNFLYSHESLMLIYFRQGEFAKAKNEALFILEREPQNKIAIGILGEISKKGIPDNRP